MVYISKVYTKFGDAGETMLASGDTVSKSSDRVEAYGEVDELNATVGLLRLELSRAGTCSDAAFPATLDSMMARVQQELFNLGAELATAAPESDPPKLRVDDRHIEALEHDIDALNEPLEPLESFILPGGGPVGSAAHLCRTVCRRAERRVVALTAQAYVRPQAQRYLNRLSDLMFVVARAAAKAYGADEVLWDPATT